MLWTVDAHQKNKFTVQRDEFANFLKNPMSGKSYRQTRLIQYDWLESQEGKEFLGILLRRNKRRIFGLYEKMRVHFKFSFVPSFASDLSSLAADFV